MAVFDFGPGCYIEAVWHVDLPGADWVATLYRQTPTDPWEFRSRVRIHKDSKIWGSKDKRYQKTFVFNDDPLPAHVESDVDGMAAELAKLVGKSVDKRAVRGGFDEFVKAVEGAPWFHVKTFPLPPDGSCPNCHKPLTRPVPVTPENGQTYIACPLCAPPGAKG